MSTIMSNFQSHTNWSDVHEILNVLHKSGYEALLAGGCVRDAYIGRNLNDFDIATSAHPEEVQSLFEKTLDVGKAFGTIVVILPSGNQFEITTFRKDGNYLDGRHPESVEFSSAEEDAKRRDFTMNALFFDIKKRELLDYVEGIQDLESKQIRCVGNPSKRFSEDKLRILRAIRFSAQLGWEIEEETLQSILKFSSQIHEVSSERVLIEIQKLLSGTYGSKGLDYLSQVGLDKEIFGFQLDTSLWKKALSFPASLAVLFSIQGVQPFDVFSKKHKLSKDLKRRVLFLLDLYKSSLSRNLTVSEIRRAIYESEDVLDFIASGVVSQELAEDFFKIQEKYPEFPKPFLNGNDLKELGFKNGEKLGKTLKEIFDLQLLGQISSKAEAIDFIQKKQGN